jgi:transcriptional regulator with XRE-family HTH domain
MNLAKRIRGRRNELGLSAADVAAICDVSRTAVLKWESGTTENLKHDHLFVVADALNVQPRWLALGEGEKIASPAREAYSVALTKRDKTTDPKARKVWERIAATFAKAAMTLVFALPPFMAPSMSDASILHNARLNTHWRRWRLSGIPYRTPNGSLSLV